MNEVLDVISNADMNYFMALISAAFNEINDAVTDANNSNNNILVTIVAAAVASMLGWVSSIINGRQERKKIQTSYQEERKKIQTEYQEQQKQVTERDRLLMDQMRGFDNKLVELSMTLFEHKTNNEFKSNLMNTMRSKATNIIDYSVDLDHKYKHLMMRIAREFEDFAFRFYYSDMRGVEHEITPYLKIDLSSRVATIESIIEHITPKPKKFTYTTGKEEPVYLIDMIKESKIKREIQLLLIILQRNGLSPEKVIEVFEKFLGNFFKEFLVIVNQWEELKDWDNDEQENIEKKEIKEEHQNSVKKKEKY